VTAKRDGEAEKPHEHSSRETKQHNQNSIPWDKYTHEYIESDWLFAYKKDSYKKPKGVYRYFSSSQKNPQDFLPDHPRPLQPTRGTIPFLSPSSPLPLQSHYRHIDLRGGSVPTNAPSLSFQSKKPNRSAPLTRRKTSLHAASAFSLSKAANPRRSNTAMMETMVAPESKAQWYFAIP
jgi:hypothetical protein